MTQKTPPYSAPDFSLKDSAGKTHSLGDFAGSWLVVYFYPKDDTPGCSLEACSIRDAHETITSRDAVVVGISRDSGESHQTFQKKYELPFVLLSDPDHAVMEAYGAWGPKMFGKEGVLRKTFLINPKGTVVKVYGRVTPTGHGEQIAEDLARLQAASYGAGSF